MSTISPPKQMIIHLLFGLLLVFFPLSGAPLAAEEVSQHQLDRLKKNIGKIDRWLEQANTEKSGLTKQLKKQDQQIDQISHKIRAANTKIKQYVKDISKLNQQHKEKKGALDLQKKSLVKQLRIIYFQGKQPALKMLLSSEDPQNTARYLTYFSYISDARNEKINAFQTALTALEETEKAILTKQNKLAQSRSSLKKNRSSLSESRVQRQKVLAKLKDKIQSKSQRLNKFRADYARLEKLLKEVELAIANISLPDDAVPFKQLKTKLPRPSRGKVVGRFGSRIALGKLRLNGLNFATKEDGRVYAVHYGRVVFANWIRGFGLLTILDHGDGYMSLYGHNKSLLKETGDWVRSGETIAYSSENGGKSESGLYFEIRKNGKPQNPNHWLRK